MDSAADTTVVELAAAFARCAQERSKALSTAATVRQQRAQAAAHDIAARIGAEGLAERVILFGSLAHGGGAAVHPCSDIDLAVGGATDEDERRIARLVAELTDLPVDLVRLESLEAGFRARIEGEGEVLWDGR